MGDENTTMPAPKSGLMHGMLVEDAAPGKTIELSSAKAY